MPNLYATITDLKARLAITGSDQDGLLSRSLEIASRRVDVLCSGRRFFTVAGARILDTGGSTDEVMLSDDLVSLSELAVDVAGDGSWGQVWTEGSDFALWPWASWPALSIQTLPGGQYSFPKRTRRYVRATGIWGYGDGTGSSWADAGVTATVATANGRMLTLDSESVGDLVAGQTLLVGSEQMTVVSLTAGTATVARGINGTVAAAHVEAVAVSVAQYPVLIGHATLALATRVYQQCPGEVLMRETIGDYSYGRLLPDQESVQEKLWVSGFERPVLL